MVIFAVTQRTLCILQATSTRLVSQYQLQLVSLSLERDTVYTTHVQYQEVQQRAQLLVRFYAEIKIVWGVSGD